MLLIESVKNITIAKTRNSRFYGEPTLFAMIVDESTGYAHEMEFANIEEANYFVARINKLTKK